MSFNKVLIVGHLGRDPELKFTPQGTAVCNFSMATSERRKDNNGENQETSTWFRITVWGKQAELANEYLSKGKQVYVEGRLRQSEFTDRDGNKRTTLEVNATDIQFISPKLQDQVPVTREDARGAMNAAATAAQAPSAKGGFESADDDCPF